MGLREKVALAMAAVITAQVICSHCMPRGLPNYSVKNHINSLISPKSNSIREFKTNKKLKKNSFNNIIAGNSSKVSCFPGVENTIDSQAGGYYRFYTDYPTEAINFSKTLPQIRNFKREVKQKRNLDIAPNDKATLPPMTADLTNDPPPQPYCFRKSNFFPEVEYPLSARDMWIPNYWSRLQDAEVPRNSKIDPPVCRNPTKNTKSIYSTYESSPLYNIIKTLNTHNKEEQTRIDPNIDFEVPIPKEKEDESNPNVISPTHNLTTTTTTIFLEYTTSSAPDIYSEVTFNVMPSITTATEAYPRLVTTKASSVAPSVTSAIPTSTVNENHSKPPYTTTPVIPNKLNITMPSATKSELSFSDFDDIDVTTASPFYQFTAPMTASEVPTDNFISLTQTKKIPTTLSTTTTSIEGQERELRPSETNNKTTTTSPLVILNSSTKNTTEQELRDYTTPVPYTTISKIHLDGKVSTTDSNSYSSDYLRLSHNSNLTHGNVSSINGASVTSNKLQEIPIDKFTNETRLEQEVLKNDAEIKPLSTLSPEINTMNKDFTQPKDTISQPADRSIQKNPFQLDEYLPSPSNMDSSASAISDNYQNSLNDDVLLLCSNDTSNSSDDFNETWVLSPNDSYITWESLPEYPDDSVVFVDTKNVSSSQVIFTNDNLNVPTKAEPLSLKDSNISYTPISNLKHSENGFANDVKSISTVFDQTDVTKSTKAQELPETTYNNHSVVTDANCSILRLPSFPEHLNDSWFVVYDTGNATTYETVNEAQPILHYLMQDSNIHKKLLTAWNNKVMQNENTDDTWASYTEIPYDSLTICSEFVNDTWSAHVNDSYIIHQQILDDSDDSTFS